MAGKAEAPAGRHGVVPCNLLVRNAVVITMDAERRVFSRGAVAVSGPSIVDVGTEREILERYRPSRVLDAAGAPVHPGFIDAHIHIVHGTGRGVFADVVAAAGERVSFADWKAGVRPEDEYAATAFAGLDLLKNAFTAFVEPGTVFDTDAVADAARSIGVRALLSGCYIWDQAEVLDEFPALRSRSLLERAPPDTERCLDQIGSELHRNRDPNDLVRGHVSAYGLGTASDELLRATKSLAEQEGVAFHQHEGFVPSMSSVDAARLGRSRFLHLADLGALDESSTLVHVNVLDDEDANCLLRSGASVVWCPVAYLGLGISASHPCRMPELHRRGMNIALGVDGAVNCSVADTAMAAQLAAKNAGDHVSAGAILEMKTVRAARAAGIDGITGSIEPGKRADLVIRGDIDPDACPGINVAYHLAFLSHAGSVDTVIVNGEIMLRHGRSTRVDEAVVYAEAKASVQRRMKRLDLAPPSEWPLVD